MGGARHWVSRIAAGLSAVLLVGLVSAGPARAEQSLGVTLQSAASAAPASWYNQSWAFRVPISIDNTQSSVALTNYQVKISLPATFDFANTQSNGNDIRFTASDGVTLLSYWIQSYSPSAKTGTIWVNVPALPADAVTTIYMYYDNPAAAAASSGSSTFPFFSNFSDPAWTSLPAMPFNAADETAALVNGKFYIIGGYNNTATNPLASDYQFNPATGAYTAMASMPTARWGPISAAIGNIIYVFGGDTSSNTGTAANQSYNPATNTWAKLASLPAALAFQGITGCTDGTNMYLFYNSLAYRYSPATNTYTKLASMPDPMLSWASCSYVNGNIYVIGGYSNGAVPYTQIYNIAGNSWSVGASMPFALYGTVREDPVIGNDIYILQGQRANGEFSADSYIYNTATNTWSEGSLGPVAADGVAGGADNGQIYTFGGRQDTTGPYGLNFATAYNPADDTGSPWTQVTGGFEESGGSLQEMVPSKGTDNDAAGWGQIRSRSYQTSGNFVMDAQSTQSSAGGSWNSMAIDANSGAYDVNETGYLVPYNDYGVTPTATNIQLENGADFTILTSHSPVSSGSQLFEVTSTSSTISLSTNGSPVLSTNDTTYRNGYLDIETQAPNSSTWSFVFTRQYAANQPSSTVGSEQSAGGSSGNTVSVTNPGSQTGTVGTAASLQVSASDSASGQTLTYSASGLPAGLSISSSTGLISGTPTTAGTSSVTVTATDTTGASGSASFTWTISAATGNTVTVTNPGSQTGTVGTAASLQVSASDSASGQTLTYSASGLPAGLSIDSSSGLISGTPTTAGSYSVTVTAKDTTGATGSASFTWTISAATGNTVTVTNPGSQTGFVGTAASLQVSASDSASGQTLTYSASGLPAGLSISSSTGLISGTPTTAGSSSVTVTATDTTGASGSASFTWTISAPCPCSAWGSGATPASSATTNTTAYELGTRFYTSVNGNVTALRFYKEPGMASTHTGDLWDSNGNLLATVTFTNESASGWQQATLSSPVAITANTPYIVSYVITGGPFGYTQSQFATAGAGSGPVYLYQDGAAGRERGLQRRRPRIPDRHLELHQLLERRRLRAVGQRVAGQHGVGDQPGEPDRFRGDCGEPAGQRE